MILMECNNVALSGLLSILKNILNFIWILGPILAIMSLVINITVLVKDPDDKKVPKKIKNSLIALFLLFFVPTIVNAAMYMLDDSTEISSCWTGNIATVNSNSNYIDPHNNSKKNTILNDRSAYEKGEERKNNDDTTTSTYNINGDLAERIASAAEYYAWPEGTPKSKYCRFNGGGGTPQFLSDYRKFWPNFKNSSDKSVAAGTCCCHFARTCVVKALGKKFSFTLLPPNSSHDESTKNNMAKLGFTRITFDGKKSSLKRGDVLYYRNKGSGGHVWIYLGNGKAAEAAHTSGYGGRITSVGSYKLKTSNKQVYYIFRAVK